MASERMTSGVFKSITSKLGNESDKPMAEVTINRKILMLSKITLKDFQERDDHLLSTTNHVPKFLLMLSGDIETNPGFIHKPSCKMFEKTVRKYSKHLKCKVCQNLQNKKCCKDLDLTLTPQDGHIKNVRPH